MVQQDALEAFYNAPYSLVLSRSSRFSLAILIIAQGRSHLFRSLVLILSLSLFHSLFLFSTHSFFSTFPFSPFPTTHFSLVYVNGFFSWRRRGATNTLPLTLVSALRNSMGEMACLIACL